MIDLDLAELRSWVGLGVAGNFAGHLEQAGEAADFVGVASVGDAPKGIFPWYLPGLDGPLGCFPLSHDAVALPAGGAPANLQAEPEVGLACRVVWDGDTVAALEPFALGAFNDCSIRRRGARKISDKKNWGPASKGVSARFFAVEDLRPDGLSATLRLRCALRSGGEEHRYGVDSPLLSYSYYGDLLLDWITDRLAHQRGGADTPLEDVGALMVAAGRPAHALIGIGATRYTAYGESTFLQPGDRVTVAVYDTASAELSELHQTVSAR